MLKYLTNQFKKRQTDPRQDNRVEYVNSSVGGGGGRGGKN